MNPLIGYVLNSGAIRIAYYLRFWRVGIKPQ